MKKDSEEAIETRDNEIREVKHVHSAASTVWGEDLDNANKKLDNLKKDLNKKDVELEEEKTKNLGLEKKVISLLDTLYGCDECGYHGDFCKCNYELDDSMEGNDDVAAPDPVCVIAHPPTPAVAPHVLPPTPTTPPWSPPANPPCSSCGGLNYGPCPNSLCFGCIPPLKARRISNNSPSRTPPGTPPPLRGKHLSMLGNMPAASSAN